MIYVSTANKAAHFFIHHDTVVQHFYPSPKPAYLYHYNNIRALLRETPVTIMALI